MRPHIGPTSFGRAYLLTGDVVAQYGLRVRRAVLRIVGLPDTGKRGGTGNDKER